MKVLVWQVRQSPPRPAPEYPGPPLPGVGAAEECLETLRQLSALSFLTEHQGNSASWEGARQCSIALRLLERPGLALRAQVEGWDTERLVREMY